MRKAGRIVVNSPEMLIDVCERLEPALYRGHASNNWSLESTIERAGERYSVPRDKLHDRELYLFKSFQQKAHRFIECPSDFSNYLEWAALIQHYSGPTRIIDVTRSYLVATFFAVEKCEKGETAEVWAFKESALGAVDQSSMEDTFETDTGISSVALAQPFKLDERLVAQQGLFLVPRSLSVSLGDQISNSTNTNLYSCMDVTTPEEVSSNMFTTVWRIQIPPDLQSWIIRFLSRSNINASTLFPGADGLGRSLLTIMRLFD